MATKGKCEQKRLPRGWKDRRPQKARSGDKDEKPLVVRLGLRLFAAERWTGLELAVCSFEAHQAFLVENTKSVECTRCRGEHRSADLVEGLDYLPESDTDRIGCFDPVTLLSAMARFLDAAVRERGRTALEVVR